MRLEDQIAEALKKAILMMLSVLLGEHMKQRAAKEDVLH